MQTRNSVSLHLSFLCSTKQLAVPTPRAVVRTDWVCTCGGLHTDPSTWLLWWWRFGLTISSWTLIQFSFILLLNRSVTFQELSKDWSILVCTIRAPIIPCDSSTQHKFRKYLLRNYYILVCSQGPTGLGGASHLLSCPLLWHLHIFSSRHAGFYFSI